MRSELPHGNAIQFCGLIGVSTKMNKTLKLALSAVLGIAIAVPALAQGFPDTPQNHWAYQAVANLKDKVVFGYPDGFYRGSRMMTRYEFAAAIDQLWRIMQSRFDGVNDQIAALQKMIEEGSGGGDNSALQKQLSELQNEVQGMQDWGTAINDLQKLTSEFERELAAMDVDVDAMKRDISDLESRVSALEEADALEVHADVNLLMLAGHSTDDRFGLLRNGMILGEGQTGTPVGMVDDLNILHEAHFMFKGGFNGEGEDDAVTWKGVMTVGNLFEAAGDLSSYNGGTSFEEDDTDVYFQEFAVNFNTSLAGQGFEAEVGRVGHQVGKYMWKRTSYTKEFYDDYYRNNGNWYFDGGILDFDFGSVDLTIFGGKNSERNTVNGADLNPSTLYTPNPGNMDVPAQLDRTLGVQLDVPIGDNGDVTFAYLWQDSETGSVYTTSGDTYNRRNVYGADLNFKWNNIQFYGSYAETVLGLNTDNVVEEENVAWDGALGYAGDSFHVLGGYRHIEGLFAADGDWGRVGTWYSPRNVEGWYAKAAFHPSEDFRVWGQAEMLQGIENNMGGFLGEDDESTSFKVGVEYDMSNSIILGASYEDVKFDYNVGSDPYQRWLTFMVGYNMSENSKLMFTYTYSDVDFKGRAIQGNSGANRYTGGLLGTQLSVKF